MKIVSQGETRHLLVVDEVQKIQKWSETVKMEWNHDTREHRQLSVVLLGSSRMLTEKGLTESLEAITDHYEKYVVSLDEMQLPSRNGIGHIQAWRLNEVLK